MDNIISFVLVNYFSTSLIHRIENLLYSFNGQDGYDMEVIVVDNSSEFKSFNDHTLVIKQKSNLGFGRAANAGAKKARGSVLAFVNPDVEFDSLTSLIGKIQTTQDNRIWGPWTVGRNGSFKSAFENTQNFFMYRRTTLDRPIDGRRIEVPFVSGGFLVVTKKFFDQLGGFDENIFMYCEDVDLCKRARDFEGSVYIDSEVSIHHIGGGSTGTKKPFKRLLVSINGHLVFFRKMGCGIFRSYLNAVKMALGK